MAIFQRLNRERGITVVQVTHEREIACHGRRIIHLKDGQIEKEELLEQPLMAWEAETAAAGNGGH